MSGTAALSIVMRSNPRPVTRRLAVWLGLSAVGVILAFIGSIGTTPAGVWLGLAGLTLGLAGLIVGHAAVHRHRGALERLRISLLALTAEEELGPPPPSPPRGSEEVARLHEAIATFIEHRRLCAVDTDRRLAQVLSALGDAIVVITDNGQVSLVNQEALDLLGHQRVAVGTSVFAALRQGPVNRAIEQAHADRRTITAELVTNEDRKLQAQVALLADGGAVLSIPHEISATEPRFDHNLLLLDSLPPAPQVKPETPLIELPVLVVDTETTGLDVATDVIVAVGAVRMHGMRIYPGANVDRLVNPGRPVPQPATAIHGIDDRMLHGAPGFEDVWPGLRQLMAGCVVVGHNIAFDIAHLRRELKSVDPEWSPPTSLDTILLAAALDADSVTETDGRLDLETLAARYGIEIRGRHTALGDALVTAELFAHLLPLLADAGVHTLGAAIELQDARRSLLMQQRQLGWHDA